MRCAAMPEQSKNSSAARCRGSKTGRCSPGKAASPPTFRFPANGTCAWCARPSRMAKSRSIDARAALALPGVHAVWTAADVAHIPPIPFRLTGLKTLEPYRQPVLARDVVRYVGEPVAVVFAEDAYHRRRRRRSGRARHRTTPSNDARDRGNRASTTHDTLDRSRASSAKSYGDVDAAFRNAHAIVSLELSVGRHSGVPMETRGAIARYDEATRHAGNARRRQSAALEPRHAGANAWAETRIRSAVRRPCRRRLRHSRRNLSGRRAGLRRRAEIPQARSNGSRTGAST